MQRYQRACLEASTVQVSCRRNSHPPTLTTYSRCKTNGLACSRLKKEKSRKGKKLRQKQREGREGSVKTERGKNRLIDRSLLHWRPVHLLPHVFKTHLCLKPCFLGNLLFNRFCSLRSCQSLRFCCSSGRSGGSPLLLFGLRRQRQSRKTKKGMKKGMKKYVAN